MICIRRPSSIGYWVIILIAVAAVTVAIELITPDVTNEAPELEYMTQTIINASNKGDSDFANDVLRWMLKLKREGNRLIELYVEGKAGHMTKAHIYYIPIKKNKGDDAKDFG